MRVLGIGEGDEVVVGDECVLYGEEWRSFRYDEGRGIRVELGENLREVIWSEGGDKMRFN